ncbi:MAG: alpha/beta hydrolase [Alphaproteobacteria bacterium]|nr:alpha/beta hydrolase [Alphaproteobacteria bacterium]
MPRVATPRVALEAKLQGAGPRVLTLAGTGGDLRKKPSIFDTALGARCTVLAFDARGCGQSEKPDVQPTMADFADDAVALMDAFGWERAHVVGYSFGGMVAQHVAIRHPKRVEKLVLAATSAGGAGGSSFPLHTLEHLGARERALRMLPIMDTRIGAADLVTPSPAIEERLRIMLAYTTLFMDEPGAQDGKSKQLSARATHDCWNDLANVKHETLICGGLHDGQAPRAAVTALAGRIPGATLRWYAGGHAFSIERPEFWSDVADFVGAP